MRVFKEAGQTFRGWGRKGSAKDEVDEIWFGEPKTKRRGLRLHTDGVISEVNFWYKSRSQYHKLASQLEKFPQLLL
jgi:hypothetical protein